MSRRTVILMLILLTATPVLNGCAEIVAHADMNCDGSSELTLTLKLLQVPGRLLDNEQMLAELRAWLQQHGFDLNENTTDRGITLIARRHCDEIADLQALIHPSLAASDETSLVQVSSRFLLDEYHCRITLNLQAWLAEHLSSWQLRLVRLALDQTDIWVKVTLPWTAKEHNADLVENGSRTLGWRISCAQPSQMLIRLLVPNRNFWIAGAALVSYLLGSLARPLFRRRAK